jgi:glycosyltransferase involved in cell wall biosynthesis
VVTAWGGSDFELLRHDPYHIGLIGEVLKECICFIADNDQAYRYACEHGLDKAKIIPFGRIPGTGGVDVQSLRNMRSSEPSSQRTILYPKAYECQFSKALPVFEAIKSCWDRISPCTIHMTAYNDEALHWYRNLPEYIRSCCHIERRIPREQLLSAMANSRVVLAPTLIDGLPNTLIEAMATGAFPIFSPLESFRDLLQNGSNVLFARNLYPDEIAGALVRAMSDDRLVDSAAERNLKLISQLADRSVIGPQVVEFYRSLTSCGRAT